MNRYKYLDEKGEHMHTLDGKPLIGTSSASDVLAKPLTWWASGLAVKHMGIPDPKVITKIKNKKATQEEIDICMDSVEQMRSEISTMDVKQYYKLLDGAYRAHQTTLKDKAEEGTDLHAELERFIKDEMSDDASGRDISKYHPRIEPFIKWARANIAKYLWSEINTYSEKHWLGGISDLGFIDKQGKTAIMDFKSSKEAYLSQFWQCAGYAIQLCESGGFTASGDQVLEPVAKIDYFAILPFGMENPYPQFNWDVEGGKEAFLAEVLLYKKLPHD